MKALTTMAGTPQNKRERAHSFGYMLGLRRCNLPPPLPKRTAHSLVLTQHTRDTRPEKEKRMPEAAAMTCPLASFFFLLFGRPMPPLLPRIFSTLQFFSSLEFFAMLFFSISIGYCFFSSGSSTQSHDIYFFLPYYNLTKPFIIFRSFLRFNSFLLPD